MRYKTLFFFIDFRLDCFVGHRQTAGFCATIRHTCTDSLQQF